MQFWIILNSDIVRPTYKVKVLLLWVDFQQVASMIFTEIEPLLPSHCVIPSEVTTVGGTQGTPRWSTTISVKVRSKIRFVDYRVDRRSLWIKSQKQEELKAVDPHDGERELREGGKTPLTCQNAWQWNNIWPALVKQVQTADVILQTESQYKLCTQEITSLWLEIYFCKVVQSAGPNLWRWLLFYFNSTSFKLASVNERLNAQKLEILKVSNLSNWSYHHRYTFGKLSIQSQKCWHRLY